MQQSSVKKPVKNWRKPTVKASRGAENSVGWFTMYFIIAIPCCSSLITCKCIIIEQTNLAARIDMVEGITIVNSLPKAGLLSRIVRNTMKTSDNWMPLTVNNAYVASKTSLGVKSSDLLDCLWNALKAIEYVSLLGLNSCYLSKIFFACFKSSLSVIYSIIADVAPENTLVFCFSKFYMTLSPLFLNSSSLSLNSLAACFRFLSLAFFFLSRMNSTDLKTKSMASKRKSTGK